ncbi:MULTISPECIES: UDP-N-acetylmuramate--L-alanine ligase [Actinomyces]|uniref:UDP-N-acetylmuramate--L-alanine ligase n=1 Tax=Actinomyces respiraculi TaxID=2744574 RepID=A0A7T0LM79_9ACTO|nr:MULTISPECIES: UDP-N-acetylmuramate--L-alanine ligase [Actinomyces]QPL06270.1 UDP-N-acetylmuramate--L-alanine ligase [Actinomyces respiraculi]
MTAAHVEDRPLAGRAFHLIGVGGAGMSVVAELLAEQGARVTGSDANGGTAFERLADMGLGVVLGHAAANVPEDAVVVVSTAIKDSNPELATARERGQEVLHRSQALALAAIGRRFVAVAGAHGKTTTSGMLAEALTQTGEDPSFAVGGVVSALGSGAHVGTGEAFVAEADESDASFLSYTPAIEVVTNVEPDHLDRYGTTEAFEQAFVDFAHRLVPGGLLIACSDDLGALRLAMSTALQGLRVVTFGAGAPSSLPGGELVGEGHIQLSILGRTGGSTRSRLTRWVAGADGSAVADVSAEVRLAVPGDHVALDAAGAWAAGLELGVDAEAMAAGLGIFRGTGRRFEDRGEVAGVRVVDDYAHHPTEITALLTAARAVAQERGGRVLVLFQPHLFSRTLTFADRFGEALGLADDVVVTAVYPARETQEQYPHVSGQTVSSRVPGGARYVADRVEAARTLADGARSGDLVLTVGAGDITQMADVVLAHLADRSRS